MKNKNMPYNDWDSILDDAGIKRVALAIKSLEKGTASSDQQQFFLNFLIRVGCRTYDSDFYPGDRDTSCFAAGIRHVGRQLARFAELKIGKIE